MTETQAIIDSYRRATAEGERAALATLVRVEGSAYRRPGARMFITERGQTTGVLSGGCLERDVSERAAKVMRTGEPLVVTYDTTSDDDIVWGLGIGCNGVVQVLIEPAGELRLDCLMQLLKECAKSRRRGAVATVIHQEGETEIRIGTRALLYPDESLLSELLVSGVFAGPSVVNDLRDAVESGASAIKRYEVDAGIIDVFIQVIEPQVSLVIFGAGDDALPVVALAQNLSWQTTVVDTKLRPASIERFAAAETVLLCPPEEVLDRVPLNESAAVVLMTHNYLHDLELLKALLNRRVRYIGCLGPKRRAERLLLELEEEGESTLVDACRAQLHAPAGLDIGAETPAEIAFSIIVEIKAVLTGRGGGLLRNRSGSIHSEVGKRGMTAHWPVGDEFGIATNLPKVAIGAAS